jgi:hypothetical protein
MIELPTVIFVVARTTSAIRGRLLVWDPGSPIVE